MPKLLIAGCGLTGVMTRWFIKAALPSQSFLIEQVDKDFPGNAGRLFTHQLRSEERLIGQADVGGQYLTLYKDSFRDIFQHLQEENVLKPFDPNSGIINGIKSDYLHLPHFVAPQGMSSIVTSLLKDEKDAIFYEQEIKSINIEENGLFSVIFEVRGELETRQDYEGIVLAIPAPAAMKIDGNWKEFLENDSNVFLSRKNCSKKEILNSLSKVEYSSRFATVFYFAIPRNLYEEFLSKNQFSSKYVFNDEKIRFLSVENFKYENDENLNSEMICSVLLHSSIPFYHQNCFHSEEEILSIFLETARNHLPFLTEINPISSYLHVWQLSQTTKKFMLPNIESNQEAGVAFTIAKPGFVSGLVFAGDYFTTSNIEGCLESAFHAATSIRDIFADKVTTS
jgi:predicted NAD/FAD-dependent oxidoreductase